MSDTTYELTTNQISLSVPADTIHRLRLSGARNPIIGQDRAISALQLGLGIGTAGYNIFIMGASGTGRRTVLTTLLADYKANQAELQDIAYAYNFAHPSEPDALFFPAGAGAAFRKTLQGAIDSIRRLALQMNKSEAFAAASKKIMSAADTEENQLLSAFEGNMTAEGFKVIQVKEDDSRSMDLVPLIRGRAVPFDDLQERVARGKMPAQLLNAIREQYYLCLDQMTALFNTLRDKRRATDKQLRALKTDTLAPIIENEFAPLRALCAGEKPNAAALAWLDAARDDLLARVHVCTEPFKSAVHKKHFFGRYAINLVCENSPDRTYIVQEEMPTFANLFGSIEVSPAGEDATVNGHLRLRPGAVHRAFGGFLVLRLQDLLLEEGAWPYLKRVLQSGKIEIQTPPTGNHIPSLLKPKAIPARLKVIIIGGENTYDFLYQEDSDFQKLFKVCAEFDSVMPRSDENMASYITFIDNYAERQRTLPIDETGLERIISHSARLAENRDMLSTRFTWISDLIIEADYQARKRGDSVISGSTIAQTIENRRFLQRLPEEKYADMIRTREILLDVTGSVVGKMNGLAVHDRGYHAFGIPVAVTAQAAPGNKGVINIERESGLSGEIYDKAHLIIQGLLHRKYARDIPLAVSASICFEQSYTEVDGDSASCAEFFALLSAIAGIPLRQDIAITGSLNQLGDVQPVGGVSEKIEGFFDTCVILGLTGRQGVIIPRRNLNTVLVADRVRDAVSAGNFHIWAINTADEGLEILSGMPAADFSSRVYTILKEYAVQMQKQVK